MTWNRKPADAGSAEAWLARLQSPDCGADERADFEQWRTRAMEHASAYAQVERIHRRSAELGDDPLLAAASRAALRKTAWSGRRRLRRALPVAAAIALLAIVGVWRLAGERVPVQRYASAVGEQRTLYLDDGTVVLLDTDSTVAVRYSDAWREVTVERGRVQFDVAHDSRRPFEVLVADGVIRDIGTRFQVSRRAHAATVALLAGAVSVSLPANGERDTLVPGQQVDFAQGRLGVVQPLDLAAARGWTQGELVFRDRGLAELVAEMNRYSDTKLRIGDDSLRTLPISGVFHVGDQASLLQALQGGWSLRVERTAPHEIVLLPARR